MTSYQIRPLTADADLQVQRDLSDRAFGPVTGADRGQYLELLAKAAADGRAVGVFDGDRQAGAALYHDMPQWWHGRRVPMAGVGGVRIAPEDRGKGAGRQMVTALLAAIAERGYPLSVLYPATMPIYRSLGWELAGARYLVTVPASALRPLAKTAEPAPLRRPGPADEQAVLAVIDAVHEQERDCGPIRNDAKVRRWLADEDEYCYLADDGFLAYRWGENDTIMVHALLAASLATTRTLWGIVASNAWMVESVTALAGPADPIWLLTAERDVSVKHRAGWMLRVVDAPAAIAARGFPAGVSASVPLIISDPARVANTGSWTLTVNGGKGTLTPNAPGVPAAGSATGDGLSPGPSSGAGLSLGPRGLAALYAGIPVGTLRRAGLADGGTPADADALDAAFACTPYLFDAF